MSKRTLQLFVPYRLKPTTLLAHKFELDDDADDDSDDATTERDPEGAPRGRKTTVTGRKMLARVLKQATSRDESTFRALVPIEKRIDRLRIHRDECGLALLVCLLTKIETGRVDYDIICNAALTGDALFYLLSHEEDLEGSAELHTYSMFVLFRPDFEGNVVQTMNLQFSYFEEGGEVDPIEHYFHMDDAPPDDAAWGLGRVARDFQAFFRTDPMGPLWAAVFTVRARKDPGMSQMLALCLPESPCVATDRLVHEQNRHLRKVRALMRDVTTRAEKNVVSSLRIVAWLLIAALAILVIRY